jgi:hypothetical protein
MSSPTTSEMIKAFLDGWQEHHYRFGGPIDDQKWIASFRNVQRLFEIAEGKQLPQPSGTEEK